MAAVDDGDIIVEKEVVRSLCNPCTTSSFSFALHWL